MNWKYYKTYKMLGHRRFSVFCRIAFNADNDIVVEGYYRRLSVWINKRIGDLDERNKLLNLMETPSMTEEEVFAEML